MTTPQIKIICVYDVPYSEDQYQTCMEILDGLGLSKTDARHHLATVKLIEVEILDHDRAIDFGEFTQEDTSKPKSEWQVAYDERKIEETKSGSRWVFFFHYLDLSRPLLTPAGAIDLPQPQERPPQLSDIDYFPP